MAKKESFLDETFKVWAFEKWPTDTAECKTLLFLFRNTNLMEIYYFLRIRNKAGYTAIQSRTVGQEQ